MVEIEATILPGLPSFEIVGLGDSAVRESRNRVHAALKNNGFDFPSSRITASYAPAWLRKEGSAFDLPLALAILIASGQVPAVDQQLSVFGELGLSGEVRSVPGAICRAATCEENQVTRIFAPQGNAAEIQSSGKSGCIPIAHLREAVDLLCGRQIQRPIEAHLNEEREDIEKPLRDISTIIGQGKAVRALQIAAAGRHNLLLLGSPGCGKTSLASILPDLLPPLEPEESLQVTRIFSASGLLKDGQGILTRRPFRSPHHSISRSAMIGGGAIPVPGEISLAHHGVLFLDEMTEFQPETLDLLRQPIEEQTVRLTRLRHSMTYPADFVLVGAANPCRCGEYLEPTARCRCSPEQVQRHLNRLSGPLLDRMDLTVEMTRLAVDDLPLSVSRPAGTLDKTAEISRAIHRCWEMQRQRCNNLGLPFVANGRLHSETLARILDITTSIVSFAAEAADSLNLSVRGYQRILRIARTIADLEQSGAVKLEHVAEALQYRHRSPS